MVALADPKRKSAVDVQESELPEVCFYAHQIGNGRIFIQIRKKSGKNTFAVWVSGGAKHIVADEKIGRKDLEETLVSGKLLENVKIKMTDFTRARITNILAL